MATTGNYLINGSPSVAEIADRTAYDALTKTKWSRKRDMKNK